MPASGRRGISPPDSDAKVRPLRVAVRDEVIVAAGSVVSVENAAGKVLRTAKVEVCTSEGEREWLLL